MKIINASFTVLTNINWPDVLRQIEIAGRTCYKSESMITPDTSIVFVKNLIKHGHESVLEHQSISVKIICDRGISHELVRHRIASYSQESTRYCNYSKQNELTFIKPCFFSNMQIGNFSFEHNDFYLTTNESLWFDTMILCESRYLSMIENGCTPQEARSILPHSLKTEIVVTMNLREWRYFFKLRAAGTCGKPHPQMLEITIPMLNAFKKLLPVVFDDIIVS